MFPQPVAYTQDGLGEKTLHVVTVMTLFIQLMEGYLVLKKKDVHQHEMLKAVYKKVSHNAYTHEH